MINRFLKDTHKRHKDSKKRKYIHGALRAKYPLAFWNKRKPTPQTKDGMSLYIW